MNALAMALRALPVTFAIYVVEALLALIAAAPISAELTSDARALGAGRVFRAAALERALELLPALRVQGRTTLLLGLLTLLLSPWLQMAWFALLAESMSAGQALARGARLYLRATLVSLAILMLAALVLLPGAGAAYAIVSWVDPARHARLHDVGLAACGLYALLVAWLTHVAHDVSRAATLRSPLGLALGAGVSAARSFRTHVLALPLALGSVVLGCAPLLSRELYAAAPVLSVALLQLACLAALFARSLWLACALACAGRGRTSRERGD